MFAGGNVSQQPEATVDGEAVFLTFYSLKVFLSTFVKLLLFFFKFFIFKILINN